MTQATAGNSAPARAVQITSEQLDAYNTRQRELGREAIRLRAKKDAAMKAIYAAKGFIAHRYASARHAIAVERCDAAFNMRTWGYDGEEAAVQLFPKAKVEAAFAAELDTAVRQGVALPVLGSECL